HGSVRAELPHTALTLDVDLQTARSDRGAGSSASEASVCKVGRTWSTLSGVRVGCVVAACEATGAVARRGIVAGVRSCRGQHNTGTNRVVRFAARTQHPRCRGAF